MVEVKTESGWQVENTILGRSRDGSLATDVYRLKHSPSVVDGTLRMRIRENEQEVTTLDQARLVAVDHYPALRVFASRDGFVLGERRPAYRVLRESGEDVTALIDGRGGRFQGRRGDVLLVDLYAPGEEVPAPGTMTPGGALEFDEKQGPAPGGGNSLKPNLGASPSAIDAAVLEGSGIRVQVPDGLGGWRTLEHRYPRERMDESIVAEGHARLRLEFVGRHRLGFVGRMVPVGRATAIQQPTRFARHSRLGDVAKDLFDVDGRTLTLVPRDEVELTCEPSAIPEARCAITS